MRVPCRCLLEQRQRPRPGVAEWRKFDRRSCSVLLASALALALSLRLAVLHSLIHREESGRGRYQRRRAGPWTEPKALCRVCRNSAAKESDQLLTLALGQAADSLRRRDPAPAEQASGLGRTDLWERQQERVDLGRPRTIRGLRQNLLDPHPARGQLLLQCRPATADLVRLPQGAQPLVDSQCRSSPPTRHRRILRDKRRCQRHSTGALSPERRPVTPEVAGSSPIAPVLQAACKSAVSVVDPDTVVRAVAQTWPVV
jgi:hypothetical protein